MRSRKYKEKLDRAQGKYSGHNPIGRLSFWFDSIKTWQRILIILIFIIALAGVTAYAAFEQYTDKVVEQITDDEVIEENDLSCTDVRGM